MRRFLEAVREQSELEPLDEFWTEDCLNHAAPGRANQGVPALRAYLEGMRDAFVPLSDLDIEIVRQVAEADRVVIHLRSTGRHSRSFLGVPATHRAVSLTTIRIDRMIGGGIAEHWSIADLADLMRPIKA